jgi:hypothetical protein
MGIYDDPRAPAPEWLTPVTAQIDHACLDRIAAGVVEYRAEIGEAKWAELQKEWE